MMLLVYSALRTWKAGAKALDSLTYNSAHQVTWLQGADSLNLAKAADLDQAINEARVRPVLS